ncbi:MAG: tetratricopeptide repeat protein [Pyrinomonas methylaliphatogenes]|nr:tetratricopeptide repeat protein [Pyrinomonas methylaliphatogenes]
MDLTIWMSLCPLNDLGMVYQAQGKLGEAKVYLKRALAIRESMLGSYHPKVATVLENLAVVYTKCIYQAWAIG